MTEKEKEKDTVYLVLGGDVSFSGVNIKAYVTRSARVSMSVRRRVQKKYPDHKWHIYGVNTIDEDFAEEDL